MLKRSLSFILCLVLLFVMAPGALAAGEYLVVTLEPGDTVYGLCQSFGIDYNTQKYEIMSLNGFENEFQMGYLSVGDVILLPPPVQIVSNVIYDSFGQDEIAFYVVPYVIQPGDSITILDSGIHIHEAHVSGTYTCYFGRTVVTSPEGYRKIFGSDYEPHSCYIRTDSRAR